jgi:hypothetical protein
MTPAQKAAFDFYCNQIETWNWVGIMKSSDMETIAEVRTEFLQMADLLQAIINEHSQKESTLRNGLSEANAV